MTVVTEARVGKIHLQRVISQQRLAIPKPVYFNYLRFPASGALPLDAQGNLSGVESCPKEQHATSHLLHEHALQH